jgi:rare lipoprotein A
MRTLLYYGVVIASLGLLAPSPASAVGHHNGAKHLGSAGRKQSHRYSDAMVGMASYYGNEAGSKTASGAHINPSGLTAAHRTLPFGTKVRVTNQHNGGAVVVTINDRGPFVGHRGRDPRSR